MFASSVPDVGLVCSRKFCLHVRWSAGFGRACVRFAFAMIGFLLRAATSFCQSPLSLLRIYLSCVRLCLWGGVSFSIVSFGVVMKLRQSHVGGAHAAMRNGVEPAIAAGAPRLVSGRGCVLGQRRWSGWRRPHDTTHTGAAWGLDKVALAGCGQTSSGSVKR